MNNLTLANLKVLDDGDGWKCDLIHDDHKIHVDIGSNVDLILRIEAPFDSNLTFNGMYDMACTILAETRNNDVDDLVIRQYPVPDDGILVYEAVVLDSSS